MLYYGNQFLYKSSNGGESWTQISQDLTREEPGTLLYLLHRGRKDRCTFLFYEKYADANAFDRHGKTSAIQELFRVLQPLLDGAPSIELYEELT